MPLNSWSHGGPIIIITTITIIIAITTITVPGVSDEQAARVWSAADKLFEESGRQTAPAVDQVRRTARVNMHDATLVMKAWRQERMSAAPAAALPLEWQRRADELLAGLWTAASQLATDAIQARETLWEQERADGEALRLELARACDELQGQHVQHQVNAKAIASRCTQLEAQYAACARRADAADAALAEGQRHCTGLERALAEAHLQA